MNPKVMDPGTERRIRQKLYEKIPVKKFLKFPKEDRQEVIEKIIRDIPFHSDPSGNW